jgi:hypothetical protein
MGETGGLPHIVAEALEALRMNGLEIAILIDPARVAARV